MYTEHDGHGHGGSYGDPVNDAPESPVDEGPEVVQAGPTEALLEEFGEATRNVLRTAEEIAVRVRDEAESSLAVARARATEIENEIRADVEERMNEARAEHMEHIVELRATKEQLVDEIESLEARRRALVDEALRLAEQFRSLGAPAIDALTEHAPPPVTHLFGSEAASEDPERDLLAHAIENDRSWGSAID
jgi:hypothetical protein